MNEDAHIAAFRQAEQAFHQSFSVSLQEKWFEMTDWNIRVRYLEVGSGTPVLMMHGGGGLGSSWTSLVPHLKDYRLIIPDRPGFGLSGLVDYRGVDLRTHAVQFITAVLDHADARAASIVANSMGALWSLWAARGVPERVERMAFLGTPALILETSAPGGMRLLGIPGLGRAMMALEPPSEKQVCTLWQRMGHDPDRVCSPEMIELVKRGEQIPGYKTAWLSLLRNVLPFSRVNPAVQFGADDLAGIAQPVLYIWGAFDPFGSLDVARRAQEVTPHASLEVVGQGHLPWMDEPEECGRLVRKFLEAGKHDDGR